MTDAEIQLQELQAKLYVPGHWKCPMCGFSLVKSLLLTKTGWVVPNLEAGEFCPNCIDLEMTRVTWEERCKEIAAVCGQQINRACEAERKLEAFRNQIKDLTKFAEGGR